MSLDSQGQWFRYHHLFQTLLQDQLKQRYSAQEIVALHANASAWYASNGFVEEAISHALAAGDEDAAVKVVQAHRHQAMNEERWQQLEHWLRLMPQRLVDQRPELLLLRAWMLQVRYQFAALPPYLDRIEALLEQSPVPEPELTWLRSEIDALRSVHYSIALDSERTADTCWPCPADRTHDVLLCSWAGLAVPCGQLGPDWRHGGCARRIPYRSQGRQVPRQHLSDTTVHGAMFPRLDVG